MTGSVDWQFAGLLRGLPHATAWAILGFTALLGTVLVARFYRNTLRSLPLKVRIALTVLRVAVVLALLACLANPQRNKTGSARPAARDTLLILVDRSDSMGAKDYRGLSRLADATRLWKQHEKDAVESFSGSKAWRFATRTQKAPGIDEAVDPSATVGETGQTRLYSALREAVAELPAAIVCLTDGIDTTGENPSALVSEAQRAGIPIYFTPGKNRIQSGEMLNIREIKAPSRVLRQTEFHINALVDATLPQDGEVLIELWSGGRKLAGAHLLMRRGRNTLAWPATVTSSEPGPMRLEFRLGEGKNRQTAYCTTQVVDKEKIDVLYYQGALQWGYRFLLTALQSDPSFNMESILNPALGVHLGSGGTPGHELADLPATAKELKRFRIVILAHVFADRLTVAQQNALIEYVRGGGGVLFIAPDSNAAAAFSGTPIEGMLPVVFDAAHLAGSVEASEQDFRRKMMSAAAIAEVNPDSPGLNQNLNALQLFSIPPGSSRTLSVLRGLDPANLPRLSQYARVAGPKPGAEVLAVREPIAAGESRDILLAKQQFGEGFSVFLATDLLWRWKMSLPSTSRAVEVFWQQLLLSLTPSPSNGLRLARLTETPSLAAPVNIRVQGPGDQPAPTVTCVSPTGTATPLALQNNPDTEGGTWTATFTPDQPGLWNVSAVDNASGGAGLQFSVSDRTRTTEALDIPPDVEGMRLIAESTGGALIGDDPAFKGRTAGDSGWQRKSFEPLWNSPWLLALLLGLYGTELLVRRMYKLL